MMFQFEEIAIQAELDRYEDPEFEEQAWLLCGETPAKRKHSIDELRRIIYERGECKPHRMDDAYLLRFLRARRSIPARAHRLMVRYCTFRAQNECLWREVDAFGLARLKNIFEGVLYDRPDVGRLIMLRFNQWDPDETPVQDIIRGCLVMLEVGMMSPRLQVLGGTALADCDGLSMKHVRQFTPTVAMQLINILGFAFPAHQRGVHVINCSRMFEILFQLFKQIAPADDLWKRVHFHRYDLKSLHRYVPPECLPKRYGGCRETVSLETWLNRIKFYKNDNFDKDMRTLGYYVK